MKEVVYQVTSLFDMSPLVSTSQDYFLNHVGTVYQDGVPLAGEWGRIRYNGDAADILPLLASVSSVALMYSLDEIGTWRSMRDGTVAPAYVADIGVVG